MSMRAILVAAFLAPFVAGCTDPASPRVVTRLRVERVQVPDDLLVCEEIPKPAPNLTLQSEVGRYLIDLYGAALDCRRKLSAVRELVKSP